MHLYVQISSGKKSLVWLRPLCFAPLIDLEPSYWIYCYLPVLWRSCRFDLQKRLLLMLPQIIYGVDLGVEHFITLVLDLGSCSVGQPASSLLSSHQFQLASIALAFSPIAAMSTG